MNREPCGDSAMNGAPSSDFRDAKSPETGGLNRFDGQCASMIEKINSRRDLQCSTIDHMSGWSADGRGAGGWGA